MDTQIIWASKKVKNNYKKLPEDTILNINSFFIHISN